MNIYLVKDKERSFGSYDGYDAFVVVAENEEQARQTNPCVHHPDHYWAGSAEDDAELRRHRREVGEPLTPEINTFWGRVNAGRTSNAGRWAVPERLDTDIEVTLIGQATPERSYWHIVNVSYNQP